MTRAGEKHECLLADIWAAEGKDLLGKEIRIKNNKLGVSVAPLSMRCIILDKANG